MFSWVILNEKEAINDAICIETLLQLIIGNSEENMGLALVYRNA